MTHAAAAPQRLAVPRIDTVAGAQVYLIRHGETPWSLSGRYTGRSELCLTAYGAEQARRLAPRLSSVPFEHVWVSPRLRARQTCELAGLGPDACTQPELAEWDYGDYDGRRSREIRLERPGWDVWRDGCPGGESPADVQARADRLVERVLRLEGPVALFTHGQFGRALASRWIGLDVAAGAHFALDPATLSILGHRPDRTGQRVIVLWNAAPPG